MEHIKRTAEGYELDGIACDTGLLSHTQARTLVAAAAGNTEKETARLLDVSPRTVNKYRQHIYYKLNTRNITASIKNATKAGIIHWLVLLVFVVIELPAAVNLGTTGDRIERPIRVRSRRTRQRRETDDIIFH